MSDRDWWTPCAVCGTTMYCREHTWPNTPISSKIYQERLNDPLLGPGNPMERIGKALGVLDDKGKKNDEGKLRFDLVPVYPLEELARVYTLGAGKYDDHNWRKGFKWGRIFAAMCRHAWAWWRCERNDAQDGQLHLASVAWCAFTLMEFERFKIGEDDRWRNDGDNPTSVVGDLPSVVRYKD